MKNGINLATPKTVGKRAIRKVFLSSAAAFGIVFLIAAGMLIYSLILTTRAQILEDEKGRLRNEISKLSDRKEKTIIIKDRLSTIQKIVSARLPMDKQILTILDEFPTDLAIDSISAKDNFVEIEAESPSLLELEDLINNRIIPFSNSKESGLQKVDIGSFRRNTTGSYSVSLDFYFKGAVIKQEKG